VINNQEKIGFGKKNVIAVNCFLKAFDKTFFVNRFLFVFELPSLRNTQKRDKTKANRGETFPKFPEN
jgi:hypothetical protein